MVCEVGTAVGCCDGGDGEDGEGAMGEVSGEVAAIEASHAMACSKRSRLSRYDDG